MGMKTTNKKAFKYLNDIFTCFMEYRGYEVYVATKPSEMNYINPDGTRSNDIKPCYETTVRRVKGQTHITNIHAHLVGGNDGIEGAYTPEQLEYTKQKIDERIGWNKKYQKTAIENHKASRHATYICNNVTINAFFHAGIGGDYTQKYTEIFVNEMPLRYAYLNQDFVFEDVLMQVYHNKIARYNVWTYEQQPKNFFKNKSVETIDMSILPLYEYFGMILKFDDITFIPYNVHKTHDKKFRFKHKGKDVVIPLNRIGEIEVLATEHNQVWESFTALKNKLNFIE